MVSAAILIALPPQELYPKGRRTGQFFGFLGLGFRVEGLRVEGWKGLGGVGVGKP